MFVVCRLVKNIKKIHRNLEEAIVFDIFLFSILKKNLIKKSSNDINVFKNLARFTKKYLCRSFIFNKTAD